MTHTRQPNTVERSLDASADDHDSHRITDSLGSPPLNIRSSSGTVGPTLASHYRILWRVSTRLKTANEHRKVANPHAPQVPIPGDL